MTLLRRLALALAVLLLFCSVVPFVAAEGAYRLLLDDLGPPPPAPRPSGPTLAITAFWLQEEQLPLEVEPISPSRLVWRFVLDRGALTEAGPGWRMASLASRAWVVERSDRRGVRRAFERLAATLWVSSHWDAAQLTQAWTDDAWFGREARGFPAAARAYFGKAPEELALHELALLAALPPSPSRLDPACFPDHARRARDHVLGRLLQAGAISPAEHARAVSQPLGAIQARCRRAAAPRATRSPAAAEALDSRPRAGGTPRSRRERSP